MSRAKVEEVNKILQAGEPGNISVDDHGGTVYTGYKPQALIDVLNQVFWGEWGFEEISNLIEPGDKGGIAIAQVRVWIKGVDFQPTGWGQNRVTRGDVGDAHKAAQTDAIKKALSYFSIGNRAYHGLLENPNKPAQNKGKVVVQGKVSTNRLNALYASGKKAGLYTNTDEFTVFCQLSLNLDILANAKDLTEAQAKDVEAIILRRQAQAS